MPIDSCSTLHDSNYGNKKHSTYAKPPSLKAKVFTISYHVIWSFKSVESGRLSVMVESNALNSLSSSWRAWKKLINLSLLKWFLKKYLLTNILNRTEIKHSHSRFYWLQNIVRSSIFCNIYIYIYIYIYKNKLSVDLWIVDQVTSCFGWRHEISCHHFCFEGDVIQVI